MERGHGYDTVGVIAAAKIDGLHRRILEYIGTATESHWGKGLPTRSYRDIVEEFCQVQGCGVEMIKFAVDRMCWARLLRSGRHGFALTAKGTELLRAAMEGDGHAIAI